MSVANTTYSPNITWNAELYDTKHNFVSKYGEDVLEWLQPHQGEQILDLGCGTGELAAKIQATGAVVTGMDKSPEMIEKAKATFPGLTFEVKDATNFSFGQPFDAIFSNATLHWITDAEKAVACMYDNLKKGGRLVIEMGGRGNVKSIVTAVKKAMASEGLSDKLSNEFWFFPSLSEYTAMLERQGFRVTTAAHFDRPTKLEGENGMENWIRMFGGFFFSQISAAESETVIKKAVEYLRRDFYKDGIWYADYVRLRVKAVRV
ncbi:class I SAM-dependent methyltransferase [Pinibacter aurantiacus]|uniref:class I SAM-dependent methyltransferase n=1 Tax=Pinibacter aurantiacus TaxID=2851599 RepID=UPI001E29061A|nr:class I SAM-dependent methyltransferase [Pinibacter aurantiacus]